MADRSTFSMSRATDLRVNRNVARASIDVAAADQIQHQLGFLRRGAHVLGGRVRFDHDAPPAGFAAAAAGAAAPGAGAAAAAFSAAVFIV